MLRRLGSGCSLVEEDRLESGAGTIGGKQSLDQLRELEVNLGPRVLCKM